MAKIFISAGHGGSDSGAVGNGYKEKDINLQMSLEVGAILTKSGHTVIQNRVTDINGFSSVVGNANKSGADFFIEIHHNAGGGTGTEAFYYQYDSVDKPGPKSAAALSAGIAGAMGWANRGAKKAAGNYDFKVVRETLMPAVLCEVCFIDSKSDMGRWNVKTIALAIAKAICSIWGGTVVTDSNTATNTKELEALKTENQNLKNQVGSLSADYQNLSAQKSNLDAQVEGLKKSESTLQAEKKSLTQANDILEGKLTTVRTAVNQLVEALK